MANALKVIQPCTGPRRIRASLTESLGGIAHDLVQQLAALVLVVVAGHDLAEFIWGAVGQVSSTGRKQIDKGQACRGYDGCRVAASKAFEDDALLTRTNAKTAL
jgi:hypothetical protein